MTSKLKKLVSTISVLGLMLTATAAFAVAERVGGGYWEHWINFWVNHSEYYHKDLAHRTSTGNRGQVVHSSGIKVPREVAVSECGKVLYGNQAWWDTEEE